MLNCKATNEQKARIWKLLLKHRKNFSLPNEPLVATDWVQHVQRVRADPIKVRRFMMPHQRKRSHEKDHRPIAQGPFRIQRFKIWCQKRTQ